MPTNTSTSAKPAKRPYRLTIKRKAKTLDREKATALRAAGYTMPAIAAELGVTTSGVYKWLSKAAPQHRALEAFKTHRSNVFADLQRESIELQHDIIKSLRGEDGVLVALTAAQKSGLLMSLNAVSGTIYDKERLELGKSTSNVGLIAQMMSGSLDRLHKSTSDGGVTKLDTQEE